MNLSLDELLNASTQIYEDIFQKSGMFDKSAGDNVTT